MFVQVVNPQNATCANGQGGVCVSQLVGLIPDNQNVLNVFPDVNIVVSFGFQIFSNPRETFNRGRYDRFFGTWISRTFAYLRFAQTAITSTSHTTRLFYTVKPTAPLLTMFC